MTNRKLLEISNLSVFYGAIQALYEVSLEVNHGEIVTIIGANGAGKSTLLMSIFGNPAAQSGDIIYDGSNIVTAKTHTIASKGIALVPEGRRIFPKMTVMENLMLGTAAHKDKTYAPAVIDKIFGLFPILQNRRTQRAGTLSGGEQQMLAIGRGLMSKPKLLLLDEPSLGLAPKIVQQIFSILKEIAASGTTLLLVEQNANHALKLANRGYVLVNGKIKLSGSSDSLRNNEEVKAAYLGG